MDEKGRSRLWESYFASKTPQLREQIIIEYSQLVKLVAGRLSMYLGYNVEYEDLVSYGIFGLIDAIDKYDFAKNVKFETYASLRIRGAILDQIRKMDWIPRSVRQKQKKSKRRMPRSKLNRDASLLTKNLPKSLRYRLTSCITGRDRQKLPTLYLSTSLSSRAAR